MVDDAVTVHQDVDLFVTILASGEQVIHQLRPNRHACTGAWCSDAQWHVAQSR